MVSPDADIRIKGEPPRFASRAGLKLEAALKSFRIEAQGKNCLDIGASTGGFTDCLLQYGAERVWALDVGHNQIIWRLRQDPRVVVIEGVNARNLDPSLFPARFDIATIDVSFISLSMIFPSVSRLLAENSDVVALVKPQFEVGKGEVGRGGIVKDPLKHRRVLRSVRDSARECGLIAAGVIASPILGAEGNREFLMHLRPGLSEDRFDDGIDERIIEITA
jgi:23S rRNA (cytidine1920-2'-O)/16S rRNA (cytidine1409-2'-O)-methyltransferase